MPREEWLKAGSAEGILVGGCLESMQHLRGTPYRPELDGAILFLETSEEKPGPQRVDGILTDYENMGAFGRIRASSSAVRTATPRRTESSSTGSSCIAPKGTTFRSSRT